MSLGDGEVTPWRRLASVLNAASVSAERRTSLEVSTDFEDNESDNSKSDRRGFQNQILQKNSFDCKTASQRYFQLRF